MQNHCIQFLTDHEALVYVINKQPCKDIVLLCLPNNILFKDKHVRCVYNTVALSVSGGYIRAFGTTPQWTKAKRHSCASAAITFQPPAFLTLNFSKGMEALLAIFTCYSTRHFLHPFHCTPCFGPFYCIHVRLRLSFKLLPQAVRSSWSH